MAKIMEKVRNFFSGTSLIKTKRAAKKEETKTQSEEPKVEQKPEEQKQ
ncbi:hypothetical protein KJ965_04860 [Patescibacteria group bacterium]|nr:hypothetical protein [Patescibacteria group bacterium]